MMSSETRFPVSSWPHLILDSILKVTMVVAATPVITSVFLVGGRQKRAKAKWHMSVECPTRYVYPPLTLLFAREAGK